MFGLILALAALAFAATADLAQAQLPPPNATLSETFTYLSSIRELSDGRIILTDARELRIVVADFATQQVRQIGRIGQGPGEYSRPMPVHPLGGDSSVSVGFDSRWLLFDRDSIVATLTVSDPVVAGVARCVPYGFDDRGRLLTRVPCVAVTPVPDSSSLVLIARETARTGAGLTIETIGRILDPPSTPPGSLISPLQTYEHALLARGWVGRHRAISRR
jgi:hypothetical protein